MRLPEVLHNRSFNLYWAGVILSEIGTRGTFAVNLLHVYLLTGSTLQVGFVGVFQVAALLVLAPLGGVVADRIDRRRLLQVTQLLSMAVSLVLAVMTFLGVVAPWHIYLSVLLNSAATTFDRPTRQALVPALVPRPQLVQAFALINPSREIAILVGPALGGLLVAVSGPGMMYALDAATYGVLVVILAFLKVPPLEVDDKQPSVFESIREGVRYIRGRPIIWKLISLDLATTLFGSWRVVLPELALDVLGIGATGYGLLNAAPPAGALIASAMIFRFVTSSRSGYIVLLSTMGYGAACILFAQSSLLPLSVAFAFTGAMAIGCADALSSVIRHAAVQLETPDSIRGRVTSLYQMASRGGPSIGDVNIGWLSGLLGSAGALTLGGLVPILYGGAFLLWGAHVRDYRVVRPKS